MPAGTLTVTKLTTNIGAELGGVDLTGSLADDTTDAIYQALVEHQVVFFRDQAITPAAHIALAKTLGELDQPHPVYPHVEGFDRIVKLEHDASHPPDTDCWHADKTFMAEPPFASILVARAVPTYGGDTLWANMVAAHDALADDMKKFLAPLRAIHDLGTFRNDFTAGEETSERLVAGMSQVGAAIHDVVKIHPVTGAKYLYVNEGFTVHIAGMQPLESRNLLATLFAHVSRPEFQVRFRWQKDSIAIWDNRCTQHYAIGDYMPHYRQMNRVTVVNDRRAARSAE